MEETSHQSSSSSHHSSSSNHQALRKSCGSDDHCTEFCVITCWKCCMKKNIGNNKTNIKKNTKKNKILILSIKKIDWRHPVCLWHHWEVWKYHISIDKWKGYKLRKRYEVTKKVQSYEKGTKLQKKGTKLRKSYDATNMVRRCYERPWLWSYQVTR